MKRINEMFLIKVNRPSIKQNPDQPPYIIHTGDDIKWSFRVFGPINTTEQITARLFEQFNSHAISRQVNFPQEYLIEVSYSGFSFSAEDMQKLRTALYGEKAIRVFDFNFVVNRRIQTIHEALTGKWLYEYENTELTCQYCGSKVLHKDLIQDKVDYFDEYDEYLRYPDVCPKCNKEDCCKYEFEDINQVVKELGLV